MSFKNWFNIRRFEGEKVVEENVNNKVEMEIPNEEWEKILKMTPVDGVDEPNEFTDEDFFKDVELNFEDGYNAGRNQLAEEIKSSMEIEKVVFNGPATIVLWKDHTKTIAKCVGEDTVNPSAGIAICMAKKMVGNQEFRKILEEYDMSLPENELLESVG